MYIFYWNIKYYPSFFMSMNCFQNTIIEYQKKKLILVKFIPKMPRVHRILGKLL